MKMRRRAALALALALPGASGAAWAADYPAKPVKIVVPYTPGGGADSVARIVAKKVSENVGQAIVIENKGGAGAILGTDQVAKAEPDGYTLLLGQSGPISINPAVYKSLPYDPVKDFAPITMTTAYPYVLVVNSELPAKTLHELVALAKSKPDSMNYGSTGVGAANHLVAELFSSKTGVKMTHVPYRGTALAVGDLLAGQLTMVFADPISALPHIKSANCGRWR
jgi:tripartite-type tricarboxylate transporter receptor subunit TctC